MKLGFEEDKSIFYSLTYTNTWTTHTTCFSQDLIVPHALYLWYTSSEGLLPTVYKLAIQHKKCVSVCVCVDCKPLLLKNCTDNGEWLYILITPAEWMWGKQSRKSSAAARVTQTLWCDATWRDVLWCDRGCNVIKCKFISHAAPNSFHIRGSLRDANFTTHARYRFRGCFTLS